MALCSGLLLLTADLFLFRNFIVDSNGAEDKYIHPAGS